MKHEIITLDGVQIIGMAKEIAFCKGQEEWLKVHFEGGMKAFQQQYQIFYKEWLPQHPKFRCPLNAMTMEWYNGSDINSPDYQCGVMIPIEEK